MRTASIARLLARTSCVTFAVATLACAPVRGLVASANRAQCALAPSPKERRVVDGIESACASGSIAWIVPVNGGVVLVDAGFDESGDAIKRALGGRKVLAVLLTHGHIDHRAAAHLFHAPVYVGRGDVDLVEGRRGSIAAGARMGDLLGVPPSPRAVIGVDDGEVLTVGMRMFRAIALPGHTAGSTGWLFGRTLFTGDAVQGPGDGELYPGPIGVTDDYARAYASLRKLLEFDKPIDQVLDGHFGKTVDVNAKLRRALARADRGVDGSEQPLLRPAGCSEN